MSSPKLLGLLAFALPLPALAQTVDATATTLLSGQQDPRDGQVHTVVPLIENLSLSATDFRFRGVQDGRIVVAAWGELTGGDPWDGDHGTGDIDLAFAEAKLFSRHMQLRAGRQLVIGGAARNLQLDGLDIGGRAGGFGIDVYGGAPVAPRFTVARGDAATGGRVYWRPAPQLEAGASFVHVMGGGRIDRQEAGVDAKLNPIQSLTLTALSLWSTVEGRLSEARLSALWQPTRKVEVSLDGGRTAPDLFVSRASIFSVFADETRDELGGGVYWRPLPRLRLYGDGYAIADDSGTGGRGGVRATVSLGRYNSSNVGAEFRVLEVPVNGYLQGRAFATQRITDTLFATLDFDLYELDHPLNMQSSSLTVAGTLGWDFAPGWKALANVIAGENPFVSGNLEVMGKLVYNFTNHVREVRP